MKTKIILIATFAIIAVNLNAQSDYSTYLNKAMENLEEGDCKSAQKYYNVYKELSGDVKPALEVLLEDCVSGQKSTVRKYSINDKIKIGEFLYRVAYVEEDSIHGLAIYDYGSGPLTNEMITGRKLPTRSEMSLIYPNRKKLNLLENVSYWTIEHHSKTYDSNLYWVCWFGHKKISFEWRDCRNSYKILYIHRF